MACNFDAFVGEQVNSEHSYGMAVTSNEVIDARYIGGMARFANHSCSPNCNVERWEVAGEICCGLFANQTIAAGDEITISYGSEFVRAKVSRIDALTLLARANSLFCNAGNESSMSL